LRYLYHKIVNACHPQALELTTMRLAYLVDFHSWSFTLPAI
jgi:hypothetical protein